MGACGALLRPRQATLVLLTAALVVLLPALATGGAVSSGGVGQRWVAGQPHSQLPSSATRTFASRSQHLIWLH